MAEMQIGGSPGTVYTETEQTQGKAPRLGTMYTESHSTEGEKKYIAVKVTTGNLVNGTLVTIAADYAATAAAVASNPPLVADMLGVLVVSATASTSSICWAQIYGAGRILASATASAQAILNIGDAAGVVDSGVVSASSAVVGIVLVSHAGASATNLTRCFLSFPHFGDGESG
jgi:hypothetical protein